MPDSSSMKRPASTLATGILIILWITSIFVIMVLNTIKTQLASIDRQLTSVLRTSAQSNIGMFQIVDAKDGKTVVYTIEPKPIPEDVDPAVMEAATQPAPTKP